MRSYSPIKFFAGRSSYPLAEKITKAYGSEIGKTSFLEFSDGELQPAYDESVRGCTVFIIQSTPPPSENLMELLLMIDAAKRASAYKVVAVIPYFGYARQDRKDRPRASIGGKLVANLLISAGVDRVMTMDLHADQVQGFLIFRLTTCMPQPFLFHILKVLTLIILQLQPLIWAELKEQMPMHDFLIHR